MIAPVLPIEIASPVEGPIPDEAAEIVASLLLEIVDMEGFKR
jgi:hypothetical protein